VGQSFAAGQRLRHAQIGNGRKDFPEHQTNGEAGGVDLANARQGFTNRAKTRRSFSFAFIFQNAHERKHNNSMSQGFTLWFTGLSGAGKTTLTEAIVPELSARGVKIEVLDGDEVRTNLSKGLGFSKEDRDTNIRRIGYVARLLSRNGVGVIAAAISPYREIRDEVRASIEAEGVKFVEVYVKASLDTLVARDVKGLYKKAIAGEIKQFTGVSDPYEEPLNPEVLVSSDNETVEQSAAAIITRLEALGLIASLAAKGAA
jgi:adenylyl-sulfate kinase